LYRQQTKFASNDYEQHVFGTFLFGCMIFTKSNNSALKLNADVWGSSSSLSRKMMVSR